MNVVLREFKFVKDANEAKLAALLDKHQTQVIESFGGLLSMIELCLTNNTASQHIDIHSKQFKLFEQILKDTNGEQRDENESKEQVDIKFNGDKNNNKNTQVQSLANTHPTKVSSLIPISKPQRQIQITHTQSEFDHSMMILDCNQKNNVWFRLINNEIVGKKFYHFILSRIYFGIVCLSLFAYAISIVLWLYWDSHTISINIVITLEIIQSILAIIYCISLMLTANIFILKLIVNTFDFWFKSYNAILGVIALDFLYLNDLNVNHRLPRESVASLFSANMTVVELILISFTFFCVDAIPVSINMKRILFALISLMMTRFMVVEYFYGEDYEWNPFDEHDFKYAKISLKSVVISSGINVILFMGKPMFVDLIRYVQKLTKLKCSCNIHSNSESNDTSVNSKSNNDDKHDESKTHMHINPHNDNDMDYCLTRCSTVYKRPFIKWNKLIVDDEDEAIELAQVVSGLQANVRIQANSASTKSHS